MRNEDLIDDAEPLMVERQCLVWLSRLRPGTKRPRLVVISTDQKGCQEGGLMDIKDPTKDIGTYPQLTTVPVGGMGTASQPQVKLHFELTSQIQEFDNGLSSAPLCACHHLPVEQVINSMHQGMSWG